MSPFMIVVSALLGVTRVMFLAGRVVAGFSRAARISIGVGVIARRVGIVSMPCSVIGMSVGGFSVTGPRIRIIAVVVGMVAVIGSMSVLSRGGCCKNQGSECD